MPISFNEKRKHIRIVINGLFYNTVKRNEEITQFQNYSSGMVKGVCFYLRSMLICLFSPLNLNDLGV